MPLGLAGGLWGWLVLHELARKRHAARLRPPGHGDLRGRAHRARARHLQGRHLGLERPASSSAASSPPPCCCRCGCSSSATAARRCSTSTIFENRLFAAATAAAFINGLSRFALLFVFVFYFQGAQGDDPITAGIKLAPMALGMLVSSPLAGISADRRGSRTLAALGMLVSAVALAGMTTLQADTPYWESALWLALVGIGSGMFNSPNTAAMMGTVPANRRGIAAGARMMLQNTGAVLSIAFVLAIVTAAVPKDVLFKIFSGVASGLSRRAARAVHPQHAHGAVGAGRDVAGRCRRVAHAAPQVVSATRAATPPALRIGEVAKRVGTTPRTIRYYEEIGLLPSEGGREAGRHRLYGERDVERLRDALRLQGAARRDARRAQASCSRPRRRAPRCARSGSHGDAGRRAPPRDAGRVAAPASTASSRSCAAGATRSPRSRPSWRPSAASCERRLRELGDE